MVKQLEKMFYPLTVFMVFIVLIGVMNNMMFLLLFIPVFLLLGFIKKYTISYRLTYKGVTTKAKIIKYESYLNFDEDLATSRRGDVKKEVLIMEFTTKNNKVIKGQPLKYDINVPELEDKDFEYPYNEKFIAFRDFNPVGQEYEIIYDKKRPTVFTFKEFLGKHLNVYLNLIFILSAIIIAAFIYIIIEYSIVGTIASLFN
ncbi:hypothetical protein SAMN04488018_110101 [Myroides marinus]|uniref:DUF3592 domain-containing protein n=1 Tax=Myroides marinus TaxID=703342 RepID=A0A1H6VPR0_9FLAO|nr:hypothetical protein [Myroides marinus]SEJ05686.1 hypothetical protein SAMN04488018_110101 [Myroides marinus]